MIYTSYTHTISNAGYTQINIYIYIYIHKIPERNLSGDVSPVPIFENSQNQSFSFQRTFNIMCWCLMRICW